MPVLFAGILPSSPLLLPGLVQSVASKVHKTLDSLTKIKKVVEQTKTEVLVIIGHDDSVEASTPVLLQSPTYVGTFAEQGDLITQIRISGAVGFVHSLKERLQATMEIPMRTPKNLPISIGIPLLSLPTLPVVPILLPPNLSPQLLADFGAALQDFLTTQKSNVAVIASGQLAAASHLSQEKKILGSTLLTNIAHSDTEALLQLSPSLKTNLKDTLIDPLLVMYQSLPTRAPSTTVLSCEEAYGITHITAKVNW